MEIDVNTWTSIASLIVSILALFPRNKRYRDESQQRALLAVSEAYHETAAYLEARAAKGPDREHEWRIVQKWDEAAWMLREYDSELAMRLGMKGRFWREGGIWNPEAIKAADIGLTSIWREVKALLGTQADPPEDDTAPSEVELMRFICPNCGKRCKAHVEAVGKKGNCPRCCISLEISAPPAKSDGEVLNGVNQGTPVSPTLSGPEKSVVGVDKKVLLEAGAQTACQWEYTCDNRTKLGPVTMEQLRGMLGRGEIQGSTMVRQAISPKWMPLAGVLKETRPQ